MHALRRWALALTLPLLACTAGARTICTTGTNQFDAEELASRVAEINRESAARASRPITRANDLENLCSVYRSPKNKYYCESAPRRTGDSFFDFDLGYGKVSKWIVLNPPEKIDAGGYYGPPGIIGDLYTTKTFQEVWEVRSGGGQPASLRKIDGYYGGDEYFATCWETRSVIACLNGVFATAIGAKYSLNALKHEFGDRNNVPIEYQLLYNQTTCKDDSKLSCLGDLAETFEQRQELLDRSLRNRWEFFWNSLAQNQDGNLGELLKTLYSAVFNKILELTTSLAKKPGLEKDIAAHLEILGKSRRGHPSTVVVAHSQGNLFANAIKERFPKYSGYSDLKFVHVAPPTSTLSGPYVLADIDKVIDALSTFMPGSTPSANVALPKSETDKTGHGFLETYWDQSRPAFKKIRELILASLSSY